MDLVPDREALEAAGVMTVSGEAWELYRVANGMPAFGAEFGLFNNPLEARLAGAISEDKGCYTGQEVVVHLSAHLGDDSWEGHLATNVIGTYNVYEAARLAGVQRVIFGSSGNAIRGWAQVEGSSRSRRHSSSPLSLSSATMNESPS